MAQGIIRNEDFKSGLTFENIRGIIYRGSGTPVNRVSAANAGAIYLDNTTGQLWLSTASGEPATWVPYFSESSTSVRIDSDVQEGDIVGIFGLGSWSTGSSISVARNSPAGAGSRSSGLIAGGNTDGTSPNNVAELFNGSAWYSTSNLSTARMSSSGIGSQNAGLVTGGITDGASPTNTTELFNGSSWSFSGNQNDNKFSAGSAGTQNAGLVAGGGTSLLTTVTELFNGSSWSTSGLLSFAKSGIGGAGSQNAGLVSGGNAFNTSELFNGSSWSLSGVMSFTKFGMASTGLQNSCLIAGGATLPSFTRTRVSELFNGSSWSLSGNLSIAKQSSAGAGSQNAGLIAGGSTTAAAFTAVTELHDQIIYRKLTYNSIASAVNIGMAMNTTNTSFTASVLRGDISGYYVPGNSWFGISRMNNVDNNVFVSSNTATISSISSTITNQAVLNLSAALTTGFAVGGTLLVSNGLKVPILGGTVTAPVVKWENVSSSASTSLTVGCLWGQKITYSSMNISSAGTTATVTQTATLQLTQFYKGRVGDTLIIPYSNVSGTNGSSIFYGTYIINNIAHPSADVASYTITLPQSLGNISESNIGGIQVRQQVVCNTGSFSTEDILLGYRNKMKIPMNQYFDDVSNGFI